MQFARVASVLATLGALAVSSVAIASPDGLTEYNSLVYWNAAVRDVSSYQFSMPPGYRGADFIGEAPVTIGPGVFTGAWISEVMYDDGVYGGATYFSDDPGAWGAAGHYGSITVAFSGADDISALAFNLGALAEPSDVEISVNGSAVAPVSLTSSSPTSFFGVTDTTAPITSITFTSVQSAYWEMDLINNYETAIAAPEMSPASAPAALTLLFGIVAVLRSRRRPIGHTA